MIVSGTNYDVIIIIVIIFFLLLPRPVHWYYCFLFERRTFEHIFKNRGEIFRVIRLLVIYET